VDLLLLFRSLGDVSFRVSYNLPPHQSHLELALWR